MRAVGALTALKKAFFYDDIKAQVQGHLQMSDEWDL